MKKLILFLCLFIYVISFNNCYAFSKEYGYNYEVTYLSFNGTTGTIQGWAILNAGVTDESSGSHASPSLTKYRQSTSSNPYNYELTFIGYDSSNREYSYTYTNFTRINTDLTYEMCYKNSSNDCVMNRSPYYEKVGFSFNFDVRNLGASNLSKYKFNLKVTSSILKDGYYRSQKFDLAILDKAISNDSKKYFPAGQTMNEVFLVANAARMRTSPCGSRPSSKDYNLGDAGKTMTIYETSECGGLTWYKFDRNGTKGWAPASWVAPPKNKVSMIVEPIVPESCNVNGASFTFNGSKNVPTLNSCENKVSLSSTKFGSCQTPKEKTNFYNVTCRDHMEVEFIPSKEKYYRGNKFEIDVKVTTYAECTGTFNVSTYNSASSSLYDKETIRTNFLNFSLNNYGTNPTGYMDVYGRNINLKITNTQTISASSKDVRYYSGNIPSSMTYATNKRIITMKLSSDVIVDKTRASIPYKIYINNLGYSGKSQAVFDCEIDKILEFYRSVDPNNPFVSSERGIGENWKNSKYNFVNVIKEETWNEQSSYVFYLTADDIKKIKNNTSLLGTSTYVGNNCTMLSNRKYCSFLRDNNYFSKIYIYGVQQ